VVGAGPLAHTTQLLPLDAEGRLVGTGQPRVQLGQVLDNLASALRAAETGFDRLVKINVYVTAPELIGTVHQAFAERFRGQSRPAVSFVVTNLAHPEALVALDAVAATDRNPGNSV